jgi:hypothetical protein
MRHITTLFRMGTIGAIASLALLASPLPTHAHARVSVGIGMPVPVVVAPPPPRVVGRSYGTPHWHWRQRPGRYGYWRRGYWGPRHYHHHWHRW